MKIAVIAAANSPHTIKWVNALSKKDLKVVLYSMPDHQDTHNEIDKKVTINYMDFNELQNGYKKNASKLKVAFITENYNVVNAIDATTYGYLAALAKPKNMVLTVLGPDVYAAVDFGKKSFVVKSIKAASAIITSAPNIVTRIKSFYSKDMQYFVVPFGVDLELFHKKDVAKNGFVMGTNKPLEYNNGVDIAIDALHKILSDTPIDARLKIAGEGILKSHLEQKVQELGLKDKVEFVGYVKNDEMPDFLNSIDVLLQISITEAFGVGGVEAMACGVPVIASDTVGASEYILNGVTGYLVKVHNINACIECIKEFANKEGLVTKMGNAAMQDVSELFDLDKCADKYISALKSAVGRVL